MIPLGIAAGQYHRVAATGRKQLFSAALAVVALAGPLHAQQLRFLRRNIAIPGCELQMFLMRNAAAVPLPPPAGVTYRIETPDGTRHIEERFDGMDLWRLEQRIGAWIDPHGNRLELARRLGSAPPPGEPRHWRRDQFDQWWQVRLQQPDDLAPDQALEWIVDYTGLPGVKIRPAMARQPMALRNLVIYEWDTAPHQVACLFQLNRQAAGQARADASWFMVWISAFPAIDPLAMHKELAEQFLPSISLSIGARAPERFEATLPTPHPAESTELLESRRQVLDSIRNLPDWWHVETAHYLVLANQKVRSRILVNRLEAELDHWRRAYATLIPAPREITEVSVIRIFSDQEEYRRYVGTQHAWSVGIWAPDRREMVIRHPSDAGGSESIERLLRTVRHEVFHQYIFYAFDRIMPCPWFNEGHAVFFEQAQTSGRRIILQPDRDTENLMMRLAQEHRIDLPRLIQLSYAEFYDPDAERRRENYALAWGLIHYLRLGTNPDSAAASIPLRYAEALWQLRNGPQATQHTWQDIDVSALSQDLTAFWKSPMRRANARRRPIIE